MVCNEEITMKKFLLAALLAGVATSALAADLPTRKAPPAPTPAYAPPTFTWTGFYVGANGGYGVGDLTNSRFGAPSGGLVGGTAGYNYQIGQFVAGVEGDLDWADMTKSGTNAIGAYKSDVSTLATARARAGFAVDRALLFVTGGYAGAEMKDTYAGIGSQSDWRNGGVIGAGLEYAFTNNISAKAEYLYAPLTDKTYFGGTAGVEKSGVDMSLVRAGLNYKF
jgi:outer membrane immunogenic protein